MRVENATTTTSTLQPLESVDFNLTASREGKGHLMSLLTFAYTRKSEAVAREYTANAADANRAAGYDGPVEVLLPTEWEPNLTVIDHGVGMDWSDVVRVFVNYGDSTKRGNNDDKGGLGVGAKVGLVLATQFIVITVKDGVRLTILVSKGDLGIPRCDLLSREDTTDGNGTTIQVPVSDVDEMRSVVSSLFRYWPQGSILVDGEEPTRVDAGVPLSDVVSVGREHTVVMGDFPFPFPYDLTAAVVKAATKLVDTDAQRAAIRAMDTRLGVTMNVPIGSVDIVLSREGLQDSPRTVNTLAGYLADAVKNAPEYVQSWVEDAPSFSEAASRVYKADMLASAFLPDDSLSWRGQPIPREVTVPMAGFTFDYAVTDRGERTATKQTTMIDSARLALRNGVDCPGTLVVTGVPKDKVAKARRGHTMWLRSMDGRVTEGGPAYKLFLFTEETSGSESWFTFGDGGNVASMTYADFMMHRKKNRTSSSSNRAITYDVHTYPADGEPSWAKAMGMDDILDLIEDGWTPMLHRGYIHSHESTVMATTDTDVVVICLSVNQLWDTAMKRFPTAQDAEPYLNGLAKKLWDGYSREVQAAVVQNDQKSLPDWVTRIAAVVAEQNPQSLFVQATEEWARNEATFAALGEDGMRLASGTFSILRNASRSLFSDTYHELTSSGRLNDARYPLLWLSTAKMYWGSPGTVDPAIFAQYVLMVDALPATEQRTLNLGTVADMSRW